MSPTRSTCDPGRGRTTERTIKHCQFSDIFRTPSSSSHLRLCGQAHLDVRPQEREWVGSAAIRTVLVGDRVLNDVRHAVDLEEVGAEEEGELAPDDRLKVGRRLRQREHGRRGDLVDGALWDAGGGGRYQMTTFRKMSTVHVQMMCPPPSEVGGPLSSSPRTP